MPSKLRPEQEQSTKLCAGQMYLESSGKENRSGALQVKGCVNGSEAGGEVRTRSHGPGRSWLRGEASREEHD